VVRQMKFLDTGEKIKKLRKELNIKQEELNAAGVSRNFISMIENGKRKLPEHVALSLMGIFQRKAIETGVKLDGDAQWLMTSAKEEAAEFCKEKLKSDLFSEDINTITELVSNYGIKELVPQIYTLKANKLYEDKLYEEAFTYYYEVLEAAYNDEAEKAFIYNKLGKCKIMMLNYVEAITFFNKCYEHSLTNSNDTNKKNCLYNMALSYRKLEKARMALDCVEELLKLYDINKNFSEFIGAIILKANCYIDLKKYEQAIDTLSSYISRFEDPEDKLLGYIYNSLGSLYLDLDELETAMVYLDKARHIRELKDNYNLPRTLFNKASILIRQENTEEAIQLVNKAISLAEQNKDQGFVIKCYKLLEEIYDKDKEKLKDIYIKMLDILKASNKNEDILKIYIKLLAISYDSKDEIQYKAYLDAAVKIVEL
jgi:HTH-type transcriptional regulator, quorum sensing regulator NprR